MVCRAEVHPGESLCFKFLGVILDASREVFLKRSSRASLIKERRARGRSSGWEERLADVFLNLFFFFKSF